MDTRVSPLELGLQKRLEKLQPKVKTPGFLRSVIHRQSVRIDAALAIGYSYDEIAQIFTEQGIECKGSTLKKYHQQERKKVMTSSPIPELPAEPESQETRRTQTAKKRSGAKKKTKEAGNSPSEENFNQAEKVTPMASEPERKAKVMSKFNLPSS